MGLPETAGSPKYHQISGDPAFLLSRQSPPYRSGEKRTAAPTTKEKFMHKTITRLLVLGTTAAALMMGGCSSSGSPASPTVSGIAATGAPIAGQVRLKDSAATPKEYTASTNSDGSYAFNVAGLTPPFIVKVDWTNSAGPQTLISFANGPSTANITPLSQLIVATAAGGTDPATLYTSWDPAARSQVANGLAAATSEVKTRLQPLLAAYSVNYDPITGPFAANQTGMDAMLDAVKISIAAGTVTVTNRTTGGTIFAAPVMNLASGSISTDSIPVAT